MPKSHKCPRCQHWSSRPQGVLCLVCEQGIKVPSDAFKPILERLIAERDEETTGDAAGGGLARLVRETDKPGERVHHKSLGSILNGGNKTIQYNVVDRVLTRTGNFHLWYEEPLCKWFHEPRHVQPKRNRNRKHACKCGKVIDIRSGMCRSCHLEERRKHNPLCPCGKKKSRKSARYCWECYLENRYGTGRKRYKNSAKRLFIKHP